MVHKNETLFFTQLHTCNWKTDKQYDTKRELYSHDHVTQALLNRVANVHQIRWANQTKLWNVRAEILI